MSNMLSFNRFLLLAIAIFCLVLSHEWEVCNGYYHHLQHYHHHHHQHHHHHHHRPHHLQYRIFLGAKIDCKGECHRRCSVASRYRICLRACNTCCQRCNCVPPGTSGNANVCPCWANMTTKGGRKKCP